MRLIAGKYGIHVVSSTLNIDGYCWWVLTITTLHACSGCLSLNQKHQNLRHFNKGNYDDQLIHSCGSLNLINYSRSQSLCSIYIIVYAMSKSMKLQSDKLTHDFILQYASTCIHDTIYMYLKPHLHANS